MMILHLTLFSLFIASTSALPSRPPLPTLRWEERSDWLNVQKLGAKGNGVSDDTLPLQAALALFSNTATSNTTLYFPPGTYLVTQTLVLNRTLGVMLLGSGELTVLKWGGARGDNTSRLLHSDGNTRFHIEGFVFDGSGSCYTGLDHDSKNQYESRVVHRNLAFENFLEAGLRVGHAQFVASAEMTYVNCVFAFNGAGVAFMAWNDYDNYFSGCYFLGNGYGIHMTAGNMYVTNTRFEGSNISDSTFVPHASSYRRVVSVNSRQFIKRVTEGGDAPTKLQDVLIHGWGGPDTGNHTPPNWPDSDDEYAPDHGPPAIQSGVNGVWQVMDLVLSSPMNVTSSGFAFLDCAGPWTPSLYGCAPLILSNATLVGPQGPLFDKYSSNNQSLATYTLPPGDATIRAAQPTLTTTTQFFTSRVWIPQPGKIFDAVRDFGATQSAPASAAIQACLSAAEAAGEGAMCYLPSGGYRLNATLRVCGSGVSFYGGGSGFATQLSWEEGAPGPAVLVATGPGAGCGASNVTIGHLNLFNRAQGVTGCGGGAPCQVDFAVSRPPSLPASPSGRHAAMALAGGGPSNSPPVHVTLHSLYFQSTGGAVFNGLQAGDSVTGSLWDGDLEVFDCQDALVMANFFSSNTDGFTVARLNASSGSGGAGVGFLGANVHVSATNAWDIRVYNSSSLTLGDYYTETSHNNIYLSGGGPGDAPSQGGMVTISYSKLNTNTGAYIALLDDFRGQFTHLGAILQYGAPLVKANGTAPVRAIFAGSGVGWGMNISLDATGNPNALLQKFANRENENGGPSNVMDQGTLQATANAYDRLRLLGILDLQINFPWVS